MFFDGDLQTGVALALEQSRVVVCFVTGLSLTRWTWRQLTVSQGANDLSRLWENEYLQDKEVEFPSMILPVFANLPRSFMLSSQPMRSSFAWKGVLKRLYIWQHSTPSHPCRRL